MTVTVMYSKRKSETGITLVELVITIVILAITLVALSGALGRGAGNNADITIQIRATALAQTYLDEILGKRYDEKTRNNGVPPCRDPATAARQCTAEAGFGANYGSPVEPGENSRSRLDDVDDFHGMDEGDGQALPLQDAEGNSRTGYDNFRVRVNVRYINVDPAEEEENLGVNNELNDQYDAKLITVTISSRSHTDGWDFSAYKSNF